MYYYNKGICVEFEIINNTTYCTYEDVFLLLTMVSPLDTY